MLYKIYKGEFIYLGVWGVIKMGNMITGIISITISAVILANVFITTIKGTNTSGVCTATGAGSNCTSMVNATMAGAWTVGEIAMWSLLTRLGVVGLLYGVLNVFGLA